MSLTYRAGNLFEHNFKNTIIPHIVNDIGAFGSGFVVPLRNKFPKVEIAYRDWFRYQHTDNTAPNGDLEKENFSLGNVQFVKVTDDSYVANMISQHEVISLNSKPIRYKSLIQCMEKVKNYSNLMQNYYNESTTIVAPMFGAGLAGGNWDLIEELILECWYDLEVIIYDFEGKKIKGTK